MAFSTTSLFAKRAYTRTPDKLLKTRTGIGLMVAIAVAVIVAYFHGGGKTVSLAVFGAALALGAVLGFLFGIPSVPARVPSTGGSPTSPSGVPSTVTSPPVASPPITSPPITSPPITSPPITSPPITSTSPPSTLAGVTASAPAASGAATAGSTSSGSSNLEQVADWVTKLLLGGGLTQIKQIPPKVWQWAQEAAIGIDSSATGKALEANQAFAAGLMVYGFVLGFFGGFLITKLQLGRALSK